MVLEHKHVAVSSDEQVNDLLVLFLGGSTGSLLLDIAITGGISVGLGADTAGLLSPEEWLVASAALGSPLPVLGLHRLHFLFHVVAVVTRRTD